MRILADVHISPRTVDWLRAAGHDAVRVTDVLDASATDQQILEAALREDRIILTQDLDFSALVALSDGPPPSVISLRLKSSQVDHVNARLERVLPLIEDDLAAGAVVTVDDTRVRVRTSPEW